MNITVNDITALSPEEKRALLARALQKKAAKSQTFPLSFAQQRLWLTDQIEGGTPFYNIPIALRLTGALNFVALEKALKEIIRRHESLRTTFTIDNSQPVQVIAPALNFSLPVEDIHEIAAHERLPHATRLIVEQTHRPFDLSKEIPLRAKLLRLDEQDHVLVVVMHHIVSDGWSMGVLIQEMAALYAAYSQGHESPLADLAIQYADFAQWQRQWLSGDVLDQQMGYWKQQLASLPVLEMPTDRPRPALQSYRGQRLSLAISKELRAGLDELSRGAGATLFMTLLAGFKVLLWRYSGQADVVVGSPIANRNRKEIEPLIGFFVNTLVLRTDMRGAGSFREVLGRVREVALGAYAHQDVPFEKLVEELQPERDLSRNPLFQVAFALQNAPLSAPHLAGLDVSPLQFDTQTAVFDLSLSLWEESDEIHGTVDFNTDLYDAATVAQLLDHYLALLQAVAANPDAAIHRLPLLSAAQRHQLLVDWNRTAADFPCHSSIAAVFEAGVQQWPEAQALVATDLDLSYAELNQQANQLAHYLRELGVGAESRVGVCLPRGPWLVVSLLAILKAGAAYVPLDASYPQERLAFMLDDAGVEVLLTLEALLEVLPDAVGLVVQVDSDWQLIASMPTDNPVSMVEGDNLAYINYTSGSTGIPKGIAIPHRAVNRLVCNSNYVALNHSDRLALASNTSFDAVTFELWGALLNGAALVVFSAEQMLSPAAFAHRLADQHVTTLFLTTALFNQLARQVPAAFAGLKQVLFGGEAVEPRWVREVLDASPPARLLHVYGPTETTTFATWHEVKEVRSGETVAIGQALSNTTVYVLDQQMEMVPVGVVGELYIGGEGLARGYEGQPGLTAERFVANPYSATAGERLYRTGDLAKYNRRGEIEYVGRRDQQVKLRGYRVEMGEIEARLLDHESVREAVVVLEEAGGGEKRLVGYVVVKEGREVSGRELRTYLRGKLPEYMVPGMYVEVERLPLTPNGKVDRKALPAPKRNREDLESAYVAPGTPIEESLAAIWIEVLELDQVGIHDNFFDLGGHSLLATQLLSRVRESFQMEVTLKEMFAEPTIAGLAEKIKSGKGRPESVALEAVSREQELKLSYAQQRLWMINQLVPDNPAYNVAFAVRLEGRLDEAALGRSLQEIVRRHEALRTTFQPHGDSVVQVINEASQLALVVEAVCGETEDERQHEVQRRAEEMGREVMDLETGPLVRVRLLRETASSHVLVVVMHHIVSDGWSMGVLIQEMAALYAAYSQGHESPLADLAIQYADFAQWQRQWLSGDVLDQQMGYWKQQLASLPVLEMPTDRPRPALQSYRGQRLSLAISKELRAGLDELSRGAGATLFMTLLAAFKLLLWRYSGQADVVVGSPIANRNRKEIEPLIGFFVNTLVLRTDMRGAGSFREVLRRVREVALGAYAHQDVPFEKLVEELQPERDLSRNPLFQVAFALQNAPVPTMELGDLQLSLLGVETAAAKFDLTLSLNPSGDGLLASLEYNTDLYDAATVAQLLDHYLALLQAVCANPDAAIHRLPLLSAAQRHQLLVDWNRTAADFPCHSSIAAVFEAGVQQWPEAQALVATDLDLSYAELNQQANQLAHYLRELGVGAESRVGVCLPRGPWLVVSLLAILKAGAAYVPLDASYPQERLAFMLDDAGVEVLLTLEALLEVLPDAVGLVVQVDSDWQLIASMPTDNPVSMVEGDNLAYINYTSGSTGIPKGVEICHRNVLRLVCGVDYVKLDPHQTLLHLSPISFDASTFEIWGALLLGGRLALLEESVPTAGALGQAISEFGVTTMWLTASLYNQVITEAPAALSGLAQLVIGGEALSPAHVQRGLAQLPHTQLINGYGPTETTTFACTQAIRAELLQGRRSIAIGRPIANTRLYVLDAAMELVPVGVAGELYIAGEGLGRGYVGRADWTAERFVADGYSQRPGQRMYRTGDLVRYDREGRLEYLGRVDQQVKVRGHRIELEEVEKVLGEQSGVREAAVAVRGEEGEEKRLVGYVVMEEGAELQVSEMRRQMQQRLPGYMVPNQYVEMEALPLSPNGKLDRRALPRPEGYQPKLDQAFAAPRTPLEQQVADLCAQLLEIERIGINDNFFDLGGHSLLATQLISRLRETFHVELPLRCLFESPTVAGLCVAIVQAQLEQISAAGIGEILEQLEQSSAADIKALLETQVGI